MKLDRHGKPNCNWVLVKLTAFPQMYGICHGRKLFHCLWKIEQGVWEMRYFKISVIPYLFDLQESLVVTSSLLHSYLLILFGF